jgi:hypothetical protein
MTAGEWAGGGSPDPFWASPLYDLLSPGETTQEAMLSTYDAAGGNYARIIPVHVTFDSP